MSIILGIDEVGRGPWAGPLVIGAVVLGEAKIDGLTDSKKLSAKKRELLDTEIREHAAAFALGWVAAAELDEIGLSAALKLATRRAVAQIKVPYNEIIIDGTVNFLADTQKSPYVSTLPKADLLIPEVSAASIIAKVARDKYMADLAAKYPSYGFENHVGYGTSAHFAALEKYGPTSEHRRSFKPVAAIMEGDRRRAPNTQATNHFSPSTKQLGDRAESKVALFLRNNGHKILARNWKTKMCEIDIISQKGNDVYFTEVKYRKSLNHGTALEAITPTKLRQMTFAAETFIHSHDTKTLSPYLAAASVSGPHFALEDWFILN
jgi:ribonuclease HII